MSSEFDDLRIKNFAAQNGKIVNFFHIVIALEFEIALFTKSTMLHAPGVFWTTSEATVFSAKFAATKKIQQKRYNSLFFLFFETDPFSRKTSVELFSFKQTNNKHTNKQTSKQSHKQTNKQANRQRQRHPPHTNNG